MRNRPPTTRDIWLVGVFFMLMGFLAIADSFDLLRDWGFQPSRRRAASLAPKWVGAAAGCVFLFGGLAALLDRYRYRIAMNVAMWIVLAGFATVFSWIAFLR